MKAENTTKATSPKSPGNKKKTLNPKKIQIKQTDLEDVIDQKEKETITSRSMAYWWDNQKY